MDKYNSFKSGHVKFFNSSIELISLSFKLNNSKKGKSLPDIKFSEDNLFPLKFNIFIFFKFINSSGPLICLSNLNIWNTVLLTPIPLIKSSAFLTLSKLNFSPYNKCFKLIFKK